MLLRLLKSNTLLSPLLIPLIAILFWMHSFQVPALLDLNTINGVMPLYHPIFNVMKDLSFWQVFIAFCLVLVNSFIIAQMGSGFLFLKKRSYLPGIIYLITISAFQELHALLPAHIATLLVLISLYLIFETYHSPVEINNTFNASFLLSLASLVYLPTIILFPLVYIAIFVLQKDDNWRLFILPILGFFAPWLLMLSYSYMNDSATAFWTDLVKMLWTRHNQYLLNPYFLMFTFVVILLSTLGSLSVLNFYHKMKVSSRKYFILSYWMLGIILLSAFGFISIGIEIVIFSTIPVAYFMTHFLIADSKSYWKEVLTWIYVGSTVFMLYYYK